MRFRKSVVCLLAFVMFPYAAMAEEEEKGFLVKMWERYKAKAQVKAQAEVKPKGAAAQKAAPAIVSPETTTSAPGQEAAGFSPRKERALLPVAAKEGTTAPPVASETTASSALPGEEAPSKVTVESRVGEEDIMAMEEAPEEEIGPDGKEKPLSKEKMIDSIQKRLKVYSQILFLIPELQMKKSQDGAEELYYTSRDGIALKLSDLDEKTLRELFSRVNNEATRLNTERIQRQIQQQEQLTRMLQQIPQPPQQPPQPPQIYNPPPQPPQPPRVYNPPPPPPEPPRRQ